jgi:hypothetical protein
MNLNIFLSYELLMIGILAYEMNAVNTNSTRN